MDVSGALAILLFSLAGYLYFRGKKWDRRYGRQRILDFAAESLGLARVAGEESRWGAVAARGEIEGFKVTLEGRGSDDERAFDIVVDGRERAEGKVCPAVSVLSRGSADEEWEALGTGDGTFDQNFSLGGDRRMALALLEGETRRRLRAIVPRYDFRLEGGLLRLSGAGAWMKAGDLKAMVDAAVMLAKRFVLPPEGPLPAILHNAGSDPDPAVRLQNLRLLEQWQGTHPEVRKVRRLALDDRAAAVRLCAAAAVGEEGFETLRELALAPATSEDVAGEALRALTVGFPPGRVLPVVGEVFYGSGGARRQAAVAAAAQIGEAAERLVLDALSLRGDDLVRSAVETLGQIGTAASVAPLRAVTRRSLLDRDLDRRVAAAVALIQSRIDGGGRGQVSLTGGGTGRVSLAGEQAEGRLSLEKEEE